MQGYIFTVLVHFKVDQMIKDKLEAPLPYNCFLKSWVLACDPCFYEHLILESDPWLQFQKEKNGFDGSLCIHVDIYST